MPMWLQDTRIRFSPFRFMSVASWNRSYSYSDWFQFNLDAPQDLIQKDNKNDKHFRWKLKCFLFFCQWREGDVRTKNVKHSARRFPYSAEPLLLIMFCCFWKELIPSLFSENNINAAIYRSRGCNFKSVYSIFFSFNISIPLFCTNTLSAIQVFFKKNPKQNTLQRLSNLSSSAAQTLMHCCSSANMGCAASHRGI